MYNNLNLAPGAQHSNPLSLGFFPGFALALTLTSSQRYSIVNLDTNLSLYDEFYGHTTAHVIVC